MPGEFSHDRVQPRRQPARTQKLDLAVRTPAGPLRPDSGPATVA
jgi:hypothetical protein